MSVATIFSRFLADLGVQHTTAWSDSQFRGMTFKSLYGLSHLLTTYNVKNKAARFEDKSKVVNLTTPFLAQTKAGIFVIVKDIDQKRNLVEYDSYGTTLKVSMDDFINAWNGIVLLAFPDENSREPEYVEHCITVLVSTLANYILLIGIFSLFLYFFVTRQVYSNFSTLLITVFDCIGLFFSYMLVQKSLNIHTAVSAKVCGVLEEGGCDSITKSKAAKLFGVFSWSEIGFGYFGVSLVTLLIFPNMWPVLALCNTCCLPYTCWSIWYQKFRERHWCTLCVGVQTTLWLLFFCYLCGGWLKKAFPINSSFFVLIFAYLLTVLAINKLLETFKNLPCHEKNF